MLLLSILLLPTLVHFPFLRLYPVFHDDVLRLFNCDIVISPFNLQSPPFLQDNGRMYVLSIKPGGAQGNFETRPLAGPSDQVTNVQPCASPLPQTTSIAQHGLLKCSPISERCNTTSQQRPSTPRRQRSTTPRAGRRFASVHWMDTTFWNVRRIQACPQRPAVRPNRSKPS